MTDALDIAKDNEMRARQHALDAQLNKPSQQPREIKGIRYCLDCDEPINQARIAAYPKAALCVGCQEIAEQRGKQWSK